MNGIFWIYCFENKINGKKYIGKTNNIETRFRSHLNKAKRNVGNYLHNAIRKYGIDNFWFGAIGFCFTEEAALEQEKFLIQFNRSNDREFGYNQTEGGEGSSGYKHTPEARLKLSKLAHLKTGELNSFYNKSHKEEVRLLSRGENNKQAKLTKSKVTQMLEMYYTGDYVEQDLSRVFDVSRQAVNDILRGKRWKHIARDIDKIKQIKLLNKGIK